MLKNSGKILALIIFAIGILWWSKTFDIGSYEALEIQESEVAFVDFVDPTKPTQSYSDRGPVFPMLLRIHKNLVGADIFRLRWLPLFFLFLSGAFILYFPHHSFTEQQKWFTFFMVMTNVYFIKTNCFVKPYSFIFFISLGVFYFYLRVLDDLKNGKRFWCFVVLSCFAMTTFFTSALICWLCFLSIIIRIRKLTLRIYLSLGLFLACTLPKFLMIYNFRFVVRRGQTNFEKVGHWGALDAVKELFGLLSSSEVLNIGLLILVIGLFLATVFKEKSKNAFAEVAIGYFCLTLISIVTLKYMGLREIEARYYFQLLPLIYATIGLSKNRAALFFLALSGGVCSYSYATGYRPLSYTETAKYLSSKMVPGDIVCTPQLNGYTEKIYQTTEYYLGIKQIAGAVTNEYFQCRKFFNERVSLNSNRVWIVAFREEWRAGESCSPWVDVFDCDAEYYARLLKNYELVDQQVLTKVRHHKTFIYLFERTHAN